MPFWRSKVVQMMWAERVDNDFVKQGFIFLRDGTCQHPHIWHARGSPFSHQHEALKQQWESSVASVLLLYFYYFLVFVFSFALRLTPLHPPSSSKIPKLWSPMEVSSKWVSLALAIPLSATSGSGTTPLPNSLLYG